MKSQKTMADDFANAFNFHALSNDGKKTYFDNDNSNVEKSAEFVNAHVLRTASTGYVSAFLAEIEASGVGSVDTTRYERAQSKMSEYISREELDAKLGRVSAEGDTKIARMEGKLDLVLSKLDGIVGNNAETRSVIRTEQASTRANVWVVGVGLAAIVIAMAVAFPAFFGMGTQMRDIAEQVIKEQPKESPAPSAP